MKPSEILAEFQLVAARKIAISTEQSYRVWINKFLTFLATPEARKIESSERKVEVFLSAMARDDYSKVSQNHTDSRTTAGYARKECIEMRSPIDSIIQFSKTA